MLPISAARSTLRESPSRAEVRDKRLILRRLAEPHRLAERSGEGIKGADGHCLAFSAGPTFATRIGGPPRHPDEPRGFLNVRALEHVPRIRGGVVIRALTTIPLSSLSVSLSRFAASSRFHRARRHLFYTPSCT